MMKDRIKQLRKELHMSQTEFASSIGLHRSTISSYECGRVEPPENIQNSICQVFKVNRRWLSDGAGDMFTAERTENAVESIIRGANVIFASSFLNVYDLENDITGHYYTVSRHDSDGLLALKAYEDAENSIPDAVSCIVIFVDDESGVAWLMLLEEYRYPVGQYVLAIPGGLVEKGETLLQAANRELYEETGILSERIIGEKVISPLMFCSPGITDEGVAFVCMIVKGTPGLLNHEHSSESELFRRARYISGEEAFNMIKEGDMGHSFCSIVSWCALLYFQSGCWCELISGGRID